jgi:hypothetical protein
MQPGDQSKKEKMTSRTGINIVFEIRNIMVVPHERGDDVGGLNSTCVRTEPVFQ